MSYSAKLFQSMRPNISYTADELSAQTHIDISTVKYILKGLLSGGVISVSPSEKFKKNKKYKSKQMNIF